MFSAMNYMICGGVGVINGGMPGLRFAMDTGAGFKLIRRNLEVVISVTCFRE